MKNGLTLLSSQEKTMSSLEISELTSTRHDSVKRTIERLVAANIIPKTPLVDGEKSANNVVAKHYLLEKRPSFVVVAQISPEFTARLVDRWQELEAEKASNVASLPTYAEALRLYADQLDKNAEQAIQIEHQAETIHVKDQYIIASNEASIKAGEMLVREFVKSNDIIDLGEKQFYAWMREQKIVSDKNEPYGRFVQPLGYFRYKPSEEMHGGKYRYTLLITPRGKVWLAAKYMAYLDNQVAA